MTKWIVKPQGDSPRSTTPKSTALERIDRATTATQLKVRRKPFEATDLITDVVPLEDVDARGFRRVLDDPEVIRVLVRP